MPTKVTKADRDFYIPHPKYAAKDGAFSGITHAMSTLATVLIVSALFPTVFAYAYNLPAVLSLSDNVDIQRVPIAVVLLCIVCTVGSCMLPDLDNTKSKAESSLGVFGSIASGVFRASASFIQSTFKTKYDDKSPDPHRGFWHTAMGALVLAVPFYLVGSNADNKNGVFDFFNIIVLATVFILSYLAFCVIFGDEVKKKARKNVFFSLAPYIFGGVVVFLIYSINGSDLFDYAFPIAASIFWGMMLHTFGDCHTKAGAPIFAPFTVFFKGKVWWTTRFFSIESGGEFEKDVLLKLYTVAAIVGAVALTFVYL